MLKATSSRNGGCQVKGDGTMPEQLNDLLNIIGSLHAGIKRALPLLASAFQQMLILRLLDLDGDVWRNVKGEGFTCVVPSGKEGDA